MKRVRKHLSVICVLMLLISCVANDAKHYESPAGYDFTHPEKIILKDHLLEISGITFSPGVNNSLLAVNDEEGKIFRVPLSKEKVESFKFSPGADFEDISTNGLLTFVLQSNGTLYSYDNRTKESRKWGKVLPPGDYESLFADSAKNNLYVLCKRCKQAEENSILGYALTLQDDSTSIEYAPLSIKGDSLIKLPKNFMASGLTKNMNTNEWYIISSANKLLLITDDTWKAKQLYRLSPTIFRQPEGIAFDEDSNLYISNEGDETRSGNILKFKWIK